MGQSSSAPAGRQGGNISHSRLAWAPVVTVAVAVTGFLLAVAGRYGPHRDELYFVAAGHHLAWGTPTSPHSPH